MSKVAAILINYNGLKDTIECIESLKNQSYRVDIVMVDNCSDFNEAEVIKNKYKEVFVIRSNDNIGFSGGNNLAVNYAMLHGYEYILLINNDTIADKNLVKELMSQIDEKSVCVPIIYYAFEPTTIWYAGGRINRYMGTAYHIGMNKQDTREFAINKECDFATGCCILLPVKVIEEVGKFNEDFFMYCEDLDYSIRLCEKNIKIRFVPKAKLWHKVSQSTGGDESAFSIYYMTRNRLKNIKLHTQFFKPVALFFSLITRYIRMFQMIIKRKKEWKAFGRAIKDFYSGIDGNVEIER